MLFVGVVVVAFAFAMTGILLTGPVQVRVPPIEIGSRASPEKLRATVEKLCGEFAPRSPANMERLDAAAEWIADQMRATGLDVTFHEYRVGQRSFRNVVARRPGSDPAAETFVIGAHYDAYADYPGADDNASGVAVLLEMLRTLPDVPHTRTHLFVAFATEEPPFYGSHEMGSYAFARKLAGEGVEVGMMVSLDMVGFYSDARGSQGFPLGFLRLFYPSRGNFIAIVGDLGSGPAIERVKRGILAVGGIPVQSFRASPAWAPVHLSDHWSFRQFGIPAVQVTDTAFMRYPHYHEPGDTPDRLDYERMARLAEAMHGTIWE